MENKHEPYYAPAEDQLPVEAYEFSTAPVQSAPAEWPSVVFTKLYGKVDGQVIEFNVTARAASAQDAIDQIMETAKYAKERYKLSLARPNTSQPTPTTPAQAQPAGPTLAAPPALSAPALSAPPAAGQPPAALPPAAGQPARLAGPAQTGANVIRATKLKISMLADGKAKLEWFAAGHQYADIYATKTVDQWLNILPAGEGWVFGNGYLYRDGAYQPSGDYQVTHQVSWVESEKLNGAGRPYRNIQAVVTG